ncbi:hypothetical protein [Streptomyces griseomycini]|uniref:Uncharacterized protein n=1 Tax=Streptomyces griseomycini TaxID=66895 RepID=A0A7W7LX35_9ACTN|nr:hypothetical protein [Streptomyces griseomycini]MBB4898065.1 hypothetical protein [Streptomyces griseomycini]GGQ08455.1 hypothetical protein GCM10010266_34660 [Streptomyces griseomycini]GGR31919.1 hypothetical protein GCM10015536_41900 [Streptomyces griseomycini]
MRTGPPGSSGPGGASPGRLRRAARHLGAAHLSGAVLLFTYVVPPAWSLDVYGAAPAGDPSADTPPFVIWAVLLLHCAGFHLLVQIPSGLLGTRLGRGRGGLVAYASALAIAGLLTALASWAVLRPEDAGGFVPWWADFMARGALGLAGYGWVTRGPRKDPAVSSARTVREL